MAMVYLMRALKAELITLAEDLGLEPGSEMSKMDICKLITSSEGYDEDLVRAALECIRESTKETQEREDRKERERQDREERERKEIQEREFELEKLRVMNANGFHESTSQTPVTSVKKSTTDMHRIMPKFNSEETDVSLYLALFERQAKNAKLDTTEWAAQILSLLPLEISQIILRESEENAQDYDFVKKLLLGRFKMSPEAFRQKFFQHTRRPNCRWKDFAYELENYLDGWIEGLEIDSLEKLKRLIVTDQMKRRVNNEIREHYVDEWGEITSPLVLAEKLDKFESARLNFKRPLNIKREVQAVKLNEPRKFTEENKYSEREEKKYFEKEEKNRPVSPEKNHYYEKNKEFDRRRPLRCYECNSLSHLRPNCPRLKNRETEVLNRLVVIDSVEECMEPYTFRGIVNGIPMDIFRDTGSSIDVICESQVPKELLTGEVTYIRQPLDLTARRVQLARVQIEGEFGKINTKAAVIGKGFGQSRYLLGNRTAELISNLKNGQINPMQINAVTLPQTRSFSGGGEDQQPAIVISGSEVSEGDFLAPGKITQEGDAPSVSITPAELIEAQKTCGTLTPIRTHLEGIGGEFFEEEGVIDSKGSETNSLVKLEEGKKRTPIHYVKMLKPYHNMEPEPVNLIINESERGVNDDTDWDFSRVDSEPEVFDVQAMVEDSKLGSRLGEEEITRLRTLLRRHSGVFSNIPGKTYLLTYNISLTTETPIRMRPYRVSYRQSDILKREIDRMFQLKVIEVGTSDYASPIILVETPGKEPRPYVGYIRITKITKIMFFHISNSEERVEQVAANIDAKSQRIEAFVTLFVSHRPLKWLQSNSSHNNRLLRWALILQPYSFEIEHRPGTENGNADALSRIEIE